MPLESDAQAILDQYAKFNAPPIESVTPHTARNLPTLKNAVEEMLAESFMTRAMTLAKPNPEPVGTIKHILIPNQSGELPARVFTPSGDGPFPVLVYFHGGGWVIANLDVYEASCRALCNAAGCIVVSVAYRQAPENKYPAPMDDAFTATQWVMSHAADLGGEPSCVAVAGESAGGNLATVTCLRARDEGAPLPIAQLLIYPVTDYRMNAPSYQSQADARPLSAAMMPWFWQHYLGDFRQGAEPYASPLLANDLRGLPPALVITAEFDPLHDEGLAYAQRLADAGVPTRHTRYDGVMHEFFGLAGAISKAKDAVQEASDWLRQQFSQQRRNYAARF